MKIAALILAAGSSSRLGRPKQLVEFEGERLLERAIRLAKEAGCEPVVVVLGASSKEIEAVVSLEAVHVVHNKEWEEGMASSIRAGLHDLAIGGADGVLVMACDMPRVSVEHLQALMKVEGIVASGYAQRRGVPAVFPRERFKDLMVLRGDAGARELLRGGDVAVIDLAGGEVDVDTPDDLARLS